MSIDLKCPTDPGLLTQVDFAFLTSMVLNWVSDSGNSLERTACIWISMYLVEMQHLSINLFGMNLHRRQTQRSTDYAMLNHKGLLVLPACLLVKVNKSWQAPEAPVRLAALKSFKGHIDYHE